MSPHRTDLSSVGHWLTLTYMIIDLEVFLLTLESSEQRSSLDCGGYGNFGESSRMTDG